MSGLPQSFPTFMSNFLKLFGTKRLTVTEPEHSQYIKGRLAELRIEDPKAYEEFSQFYGVFLDVVIQEKPATEQEPETENVGKKRGRPAKIS